jgi:acyl-CoA dehydrogenase
MTMVEPDISMDDLTDGLGRFVDSVVLPLEEERRDLFENPRLTYRDDGAFAPEVQALIRRVKVASADAGYYQMFCPTSIGGGGLGKRHMFDAYEYLYRRYGPSRRLPYETISHWATGPSFLCEGFTPEARDEVLEDVVGGKVGMCFGMSEPDAGSDAWMMTTRAVRDGTEWVISGTKQWTTNSPIAEFCYLFAVTDPALHRERRGGVTCFIVPMQSPGVRVDSVIRMFGEIGGNEGIVSFNDVRVPDRYLVGSEGGGFKLALGGVSLGRVYNSARAVGLARWLLERAVEHARVRVTFGKPIVEHQGVSFKLADSAMEIYAARAAALDLTSRLDAGEPAIRELAMTKAFCAEMFLRVADRCMQVCGAMGLTNEMHMYAAWHQARAMQLADGSAEILRVTVANRLLRGELDF